MPKLITEHLADVVPGQTDVPSTPVAAASPRQRSVRMPSTPTTQTSRGRRTPGMFRSALSSMSLGDNNSWPEWTRARCRSLSDNWKFNVLTTVLTLFALFGDDCRLAATHKSTDIVFDTVTLVCCVVFAFEIVVASVGQAEYFLGFFFCLDVGATVTLVFDLTWIGNALFCTSDDGSGALRSSRAGRAGARAGRTVRIIRLMRLAKLYKAYRAKVEAKKAAEAGRQRMEALAQRSKASKSSFLPPGEDGEEWMADGACQEEDIEGGLKSSCSISSATYTETSAIGSEDLEKKSSVATAPEEDGLGESRVGKKLSDMTTRRVIVLVLVMLISMPQFTPSSHGFEEFLYSSSFASEVVYERWRTYCGNNVSQAPTGSGSRLGCLQSLSSGASERDQVTRSWFEKALLNFVYTHHAGSFAHKLYWVGVNSTTMPGNYDEGYDERVSSATAFLGEFMPLNQARFLGSFAYPKSEWNAFFAGGGDWNEKVVPLEEAVIERLVSPWTQLCSSHVGFTVQPDVEAADPAECTTTRELRCSEREFMTPLWLSTSDQNEFSILFTFDTRGSTQLEATLNVMQTIFICFAVGLGAMAFSKDANQLLLHPIERMIAKMETIKDNPFDAMKLGDLEYRREEVEAAKKKEALAKMSRLKRLLFRYKYTKVVKEPMETVMLEKTIIRLGGLLALGFGEAGAEITGRYVSSGSGLVENVPGLMVDCVFGFAAIRDFHETMRVLGDRTLVFVNQVSEIVHGCADDWHGAPSKNLGNAFMLVWRLSTVPQERQHRLVDMSVITFVKVVAELNKSRWLAQFRNWPALAKKMQKSRVNMGFGLHVGWAIEGAIGSEYKIDAAYFSPNVNIAGRLQASTTDYGVDILLSDSMARSCSKELMSICRLIDHVTVKGSRKPMRLYTLDLDASAVAVVKTGREPVSRNRFKIRQLRELRKSELWHQDASVLDLFHTDPDILGMRSKFSKEFFNRFSMAYRNYETGEWFAARDMLFTCHYQPRADVGRLPLAEREEWPEDGPSRMLLTFMREFGYEPPLTWPGHRKLPLDPHAR